MEPLRSTVIRLLTLLAILNQHQTNQSTLSDLTFRFPGHEGINNCQRLLHGIYKERKFDAVLVVHQKLKEDPNLRAILHFDLPKVIVTKQPPFIYKETFNSDILVALLMTSSLDYELIEAAAQALDYRRQSRILMIAVNVADSEIFKRDFLKLCQTNKMTNVLLIYYDSWGEKAAQYYRLKPYPDYHWQSWSINESVYFVNHWHNMHNKSLMTFIEQSASRALLFADPQGNLKMSGFVARLILLFAEHFNATLSMYYPLQVGNITHYSVINGMVSDNLLDIPMALEAVKPHTWQNASDTYDINQVVLMVPHSQPLSVREIFVVLLNGNFFGSFIITAMLLSFVHALIEYCLEKRCYHLDLVINDRILPGVLGQSFLARSSPITSLRLVYFLVGFVGLNIGTQFSANVNTLFTTPPYQPQIHTHADLLRSPLKILVDVADAQQMGNWLVPIAKSVVFTTNKTKFYEYRQHLNATYAYYATTPTWNILWWQQMYFSRKAFHAPKDMIYASMLPMSFRLQYNSPYKEPLNYLIHRVQSVGLVEAWHASLFSDMLKLNQISIRDPRPAESRKILNANDFFWVWMIVLIGLGGSLLVFLVELGIDWWIKRLNRRR